MSPRPKQTSMAKAQVGERGSRRAASQYIPRNNLGNPSLSSTSFTSDMSEYSMRSRSETLQSDDSLVWNGTFSGHYSGHDDAHFDSLPMDTLPMSDNSYLMPVIPGSQCYNPSTFDHFSQGPMSQTLTGPLLESSYQDVMMGDDMMHGSPISVEFPGYSQTTQHTWRHGQLSPPAEIFYTDLNDLSMDPSCDEPFQGLPESATSEIPSYDRITTRSVHESVGCLNVANQTCSILRPSQPRPIRSASEKSTMIQATMAPQDIHYSRSDRADKVRARNDPRYDVGPDKDGYYHCPMVGEGSCNHKPTKQKCIYAKYLDSHLKPYVCTHGEKGSECDGARFSSNACLFRHEREAHGMHNHGLNPYLCLFPGCERSRQGNGFPRRWNQRDHMKRVHDWEEPETSGYDNQDRVGPTESTKRRKSGHSHAVQMKRSSSSHAKAQAATYAHGSRHGVSMSRYVAQAEKELQSNMMAYPMQFNDASYSQIPAYQPQPRSSEAYSNSYLVAY